MLVLSPPLHFLPEEMNLCTLHTLFNELRDANGIVPAGVKCWLALLVLPSQSFILFPHHLLAVSCRVKERCRHHHDHHHHHHYYQHQRHIIFTLAGYFDQAQTQ